MKKEGGLLSTRQVYKARKVKVAPRSVMQIWMPRDHAGDGEDESPTVKLKEIIGRSKSPVKKRFIEKLRAKEIEDRDRKAKEREEMRERRKMQDDMERERRRIQDMYSKQSRFQLWLEAKKHESFASEKLD